MLLPSATFLFLSCGAGGRDEGVAAGPSVVVVTLDTTRADRVGAGLTPRIDALASEGTRFDQAVAPVPLTLPSHASLMTGQLPVHHGVRNNGTYRLGEDADTLAERYRAAGYRTGAFVAASVLGADRGLSQGFERYDDHTNPGGAIRSRSGQEVVDAALAWLGEQDEQPVFVWVHLFDPHAPYEPPGPERERYADRPYDGEVAYADRQVGRLLDGLGPRRDDAIIVVTADHGEALGAHGEDTHGILVHDATLRIPLVLRGPRRPAVASVGGQVQLVDVAPTLLAMSGLEPLPQADGQDLAPRMAGTSPPEAPAVVESLYPQENLGWAPLRGVRTARYKLVEGTRAELFDLASDPAELVDVASTLPAQAAQLGTLLGDWRPGSGVEEALGEDQRQELAALGYVWSDGPASGVDPRDGLVELLRRLAEADAEAERGCLGRARDLSLAVLRDYAGSTRAAEQAARLTVLQTLPGRPPEPRDCDR